MDDKPKSIWKKSWTGWGWLWAWLVLVAAIFFVNLIVILLIPGEPRDFGLALAFTFFGSVVGAVVVGLWAFIRYFSRWCNFKRLLFGLVCLATLIALFYAEEDWRGWHAWSSFKHEWEAKGEHFDFASVIPPAVPDEQNFALTPIVFTSYGRVLTRDGKQIPDGQRQEHFVERIKMETYHDYTAPTNTAGNREKGKLTNLEGWQSYYRDLAAKNLADKKTNEFPVPAQPGSPAADVLLALSKYDPVIEELRQASQLPYSRFPLNYDKEKPFDILLPHLAALKGCCQVLQLRASAELQNGQPDKAADDVKLALELTGKFRTEPFIISHLVRIAMLQITLQPIWEGLAEHRWSDKQLAALDAELAKLDFLADYKLSLRGEMGCSGGVIDHLRRHPELFMFLSSENQNQYGGQVLPFPARIIWHTIPSGWFYQNLLRCDRMTMEHYIPVANAELQTVSPSAARHADEVLRAEFKKRTPYNILEGMLMPAIGKVVQKYAYAQSSTDLARVAIALERYRLARGEFPESLDALAPQFIAQVPHDVIGGQPLKYRREADGQFVLYSVGWNETDDGGVVVNQKSRAPRDESNSKVDISQGDWVWRYPAK